MELFKSMKWPYPRLPTMNGVRFQESQDQSEHLKKKIFQLQIEMTDFSKHITNTTRKQNPNKIDPAIPLSKSSCDWLRTCVLSITKCVMGLLCVTSCMTWPLLFPLFVYFSEGRSYLFWKLVCISILLVLGLTLRIVVELQETINLWIADATAAMRLFHRKCSESINRLWSVCMNILKEKITSTDSSISGFLHQVSIKIILITSRRPVTVSLGVSLMILILMMVTRRKAIYIFCVALLMSGFLLGVAVTNLTKSLNWSGYLSYYLPSRNNPLLPLEFKTPLMPNSHSFLGVSDESVSVFVGKGQFPRSPPPTYQEALGCPPFVHSLYSEDVYLFGKDQKKNST